MRIAFISFEYPPDSSAGGIATYDVDMAVAGLPSFGTVAADIMFTCHKMNVVLYGLLVKEDTPTLDMLGYSLDYLRGSSAEFVGKNAYRIGLGVAGPSCVPP